MKYGFLVGGGDLAHDGSYCQPNNVNRKHGDGYTTKGHCALWISKKSSVKKFKFNHKCLSLVLPDEIITWSQINQKFAYKGTYDEAKTFLINKGFKEFKYKASKL